MKFLLPSEAIYLHRLQGATVFDHVSWLLNLVLSTSPQQCHKSDSESGETLLSSQCVNGSTSVSIGTELQRFSQTVNGYGTVCFVGTFLLSPTPV